MPVVRRSGRHTKDQKSLQESPGSGDVDDIPMEPAEPAEPMSELSELLESVIDNDADSDFEEPKPLRGRKRGRPPLDPSAKKQRAAKAPSRKKVDTGGEDEGSLFDVVKSSKTALSTLVDDWIELYKQDRDTALLDLIQFFIRCSGCRGTISADMYHNMEHTEIIRKMTEQFDEESGDYPLILPGPVWKKFRANFCDFIMVLVRQCQYSIIYDQYMMDSVISLLTGLTDSQVRAFRHTSTLAAMKLMTALVDVALNLSINLDHTQRQYEAERTKNRAKQASERLEMLTRKRLEIEENQEEIRNMLTYIFKGVFVHRYRDTQPDIRGICMAEIGVWMKRYPGMFLDDSYLKYVGWTLYDRVGDVRMCCLKCLLPLYNSEELAPRLELFTNRFKDRIAEMTLDKEYDVAVHGVKLAISIIKYNEGVLNDKDCENVYELVYSSHRAVAQSAGEFLNQKLFIPRNPDENSAVKVLKTKKGKKRSENTPLVRDLVQFFIESELHEHGAYLVDSLWEINDMLKDWECMTDLLLEEPGRGEEPMDDRHETSLIEIMVCCVKQAATGEYPVGRGPNRKLTTKELKQVMEDKTRLTEHFIVTLPQLLAKYTVDAEKIANLLQIPLYFDLEIYTSSRQEKYLDSLLRHMADIVDKHTDSEVLENCSRVLDSLSVEEYSISGKCNVAKSTLIDSLVQKYKEAFQDFFQEGEEPDEDDAYALLASLKRIQAFYSSHDLNPWNLWDSLFFIVSGGHEGNMLPEEIVCKAIVCCSKALLWFLEALDENSPDKALMKQLKKSLHQFMQTCYGLLYHQQDSVQQESYISICDLLIVFSKQLGTTIAVFEPLVYEPDVNVQGQLSGFLNDKVFVEDEDDDIDENQKIEELHKRRNFLASFCKLVVYNVVSIKMAADMFKYYMKFYNDYGDIIKATLAKSREISKVLTAKTLAISLTQLFTELQSEQGWNVDRSSQGYTAIKDLARRFSLSFGLDQVKNRDAVATMHKEGILFSLNPRENPQVPGGPPPNVGFLEILVEFSSKLMKQDKKVVVAFLDKQTQGLLPDESSDLWSALFTYHNSLEHDGPAAHPGGDGATRPRAGQRRGAGAGRGGGPAKRRLLHVEDDPTTQWVIKETHTPAPGSNQPLTSTVLKRKRVDAPPPPPPRPDSGSERSDVGSDSEQDFDISTIADASWLSEHPERPIRHSSRLVDSPLLPASKRRNSLSAPLTSIDDITSPESNRIEYFDTPSQAAFLKNVASAFSRNPTARHVTHSSPSSYLDDDVDIIDDSDDFENVMVEQ